jgi:subtilisin family serine protease
MANRPLIMMATVVLLAVLVLGLIPGPAPVASDDPENKISGSLELLMREKSGQRDMLLQGTGPVDQILLAETGRATVFIYLDRPPDAAVTAGLQSAGATVYTDSWIPPVGLHPRGFITASVPLDGISSLAGLSYVAKIDSAEAASQPQNDLAAVAIGTQAYWPAGYNGAGVRIAVLDSGLDTTFPDIPTPVAAKDYSTYPVIGDNVTSPVIGAGAHGTHVTGSALGRGTLSGGKYKGMAYDSELVFLKIGNNTNAGSSDEIEVAALKDAVDIYQANVINMSYGGWSAHHDGSSAPSQAVDYATSKGATVCISAGNEADKGTHYSGTLPAHTSVRVPVVVSGSDGSNCTLRHNLVWWDGVGVHDNLTMVYYDGDTALPTQSTLRDESVRGTEQQYWWWGNNPSHWYFIPADKTSYGIAVSNNSDNTRQFHLYFTGQAERGAAVRFEGPDIYYTLGCPGEADSAITSGAYTTRTSWTDFRGYSHTSDEVMNTVTTFSSRGPRVDPGAPQKPTIVSPGSEIISCRDRGNYPVDNLTISDNGINNGTQPANYLVMEGTSMASPVTTGMVAVLMEAYPGLKINPVAVKNLLQQSATRYSAPDNNWGYGLVSLQRVAQMWPQSATVPSSAGQGTLTFSTSAGTIGNVRTMDASALGSSCAAGPNLFPYGVFAFDISGILPGSSVDITITMPDSRATIYWKCTPSGLVQMPVVSTSSNTMVIRLTDGGPGDADGVANGVIVDPGGPGLPLALGLAAMPASRSSSPVTTTVMQPVMLPDPNVTAQSATRSPAQPETNTPASDEGDTAGESFAIAVMAALIAAIGVVIVMLWLRRRAY